MKRFLTFLTKRVENDRYRYNIMQAVSIFFRTLGNETAREVLKGMGFEPLVVKAYSADELNQFFQRVRRMRNSLTTNSDGKSRPTLRVGAIAACAAIQSARRNDDAMTTDDEASNRRLTGATFPYLIPRVAGRDLYEGTGAGGTGGLHASPLVEMMTRTPHCLPSGEQRRQPRRAREDGSAGEMLRKVGTAELPETGPARNALAP